MTILKELNNYLNQSLELKNIEYHSVPALKDLSPKSPVLHIPEWPYQKDHKLEFICYDFSVVLILNENDLTFEISYNRIKEFIQKDYFFDILNDINLPFEVPVFILVSYDFGFTIENIVRPKSFYKHPWLVILIPGNSIVMNHSEKKAWQLINSSGKTIQFNEPVNSTSALSNEVILNVSHEHYLSKIEQIRDLIRDGEVYQINYTIRLSTALPASPYQFFNRLYHLNSSPFSFYLNLGQFQLVSNSPERFLRVKGTLIETEPIKGTIKRGCTKNEDEELKNKLLSSEKDRAELSMIVDLLRNDLNRICEPGSVHVAEHARLETYENVHHLVSTIQGELKKIHLADILNATFPGGSITGCPKIAAMNYISRLEEHNRSFYTGSFFIYYPQRKELDSSILIRTALIENGNIHFHVGGGIVIDSDPEAEYQECMAKAGSFLKIVKNQL